MSNCMRARIGAVFDGLCCAYVYNKSSWFDLALRVVTRLSLLLRIETLVNWSSNVAANVDVCINLLVTDYFFFQILAHPVFKM
jgi:hypothetical protein